MPRPRPYVGMVRGALHFFESVEKPTEKTHGDRFVAVVGPFRTIRAARWAEKFGYMNPHFVCVEDAEVISKARASNNF